MDLFTSETEQLSFDTDFNFFVRFVSLSKNIALGHVHTPYFDVFNFVQTYKY